jgi:hypothetical protein
MSENNNFNKVFDQFKIMVESHGLTIERIDEENLIHLKRDDYQLKISLDNALKAYERDGNLDYLDDLVNSIVSYDPGLPSWPEARESVFKSLFPNDYDYKDFVHEHITDEFGAIYIFDAEGSFAWISREDLSNWGITTSELAKQADLNGNRVLKDSVLEVTLIEERKLGILETKHVALKSSLLFNSGFKGIAIPEFGTPFYAVIPVRDFCYIFGAADLDFFASRLGKTVVREFKESGYPITTEVLEFSDEGVKAIGKYPTE